MEVLVDDVIYCSRELVELANDSLRGMSAREEQDICVTVCVACPRVRRRIHA